MRVRNKMTTEERGAMVDLSFQASGNDFLITAYSERGRQWLVDYTNTITIEPEADAGRPPVTVGKCWIETKAEFERLYARAAAAGSGFTVAISPPVVASNSACEARQ
ncbi:MAG TPA: hypothetical protein VLJ17_03755 [Xanthobacteraceae bacterium]|nr:hypothetical protein [Xanthobacteraceae bacterium]